MNRNVFLIFLLVLSLSVLCACSSEPAANQEKKAATNLQKITGKAQVLPPVNAADAALNAGGQSVYLWEGKKRYRLFLKSPVEAVHDKEYVVTGVYAQKVIDELGDPDQGKKGYPLDSSCARAVRMAWTGLSFDAADSYTAALKTLVKRYPARPVFLVTRIEPAEGPAKAEDEDETPPLAVPEEKQSALLTAGSTTQKAPLWDPAGGTAHCKVIIGKDGKVAELETGAQLCEAVPWSQFQYKPTEQKGKPVRVKTEIDIRFEPRT